MTMDMQQQPGGGVRFRLGPVEKAIATFVVGLITWMTYSFISGVGELRDGMGDLNERTTRIEEKVSSGNRSLDSVLPLVADHAIKLTDHEARIKQAEKEIDNLQKTRGLR